MKSQQTFGKLLIVFRDTRLSKLQVCLIAQHTAYIVIKTELDWNTFKEKIHFHSLFASHLYDSLVMICFPCSLSESSPFSRIAVIFHFQSHIKKEKYAASCHCNENILHCSLELLDAYQTYNRPFPSLCRRQFLCPT